jgi:rod shape-determining protein MreC
MPRLFTTLILYRQTVTFTLTVMISIVLLSLSPQNQVLVSRSVMMTVLTPVQQVFSFIPSFFNLRQENHLLREELVTLQLQNADLRESTLENLRLRSLLGFKRRPEFTYLPAEVIAHDAGRVLNGVVIDMGSRDGVRPYMAVVTSQGLAGRVVETGPLSSLVQLLTDRSCRISSIVERSRVKGTIAGRLYDGLDLMLPLRADVRIGDNVVSSGLGGTFPPGLLVGRVQGLRIEESGVFKQIDIAPVVDFDRLEEVFVVVPQAEAGSDSMSAISSSDYQSLLPGRVETALSSRQ